MLRLTQDDIIPFDSIRCLNYWSLTFCNPRATCRTPVASITSIKCVCFNTRYSTVWIGAWDNDLWSLSSRQAKDCSSNWTDMEQRHHFFRLLIDSSSSSTPLSATTVLNSCAFYIFQCVSHTIFHSIYFFPKCFPKCVPMTACVLTSP